MEAGGGWEAKITWRESERGGDKPNGVGRGVFKVYEACMHIGPAHHDSFIAVAYDMCACLA